MIITTKSIVSSSDMIKNYKRCREMAEANGRIYILKNNQPNAVLFSITEYERISALLERVEGLDKNKIEKIEEKIAPIIKSIMSSDDD